MDDTHKLPKAVIILGPTGSGKTGWGLKMAKKFNAEVISADSRQMYQKMTIGTAKPLGEWRRSGFRRTFYVEDVPHHLIDFLDPGKLFTVANFRDRSIKHAKMAHHDGRLPLIVGGTGLYIHSFIDNLQIPRIPPNAKLRKSFEEKTNLELLKWLERLDPKTAQCVDPQNKRRIIRALEVCILSGTPFSQQQTKGDPVFDVLQIGIKIPRDILYTRIDARTDDMIKQGLVEEVRHLIRQKYGWELPSMSGIGYKQFKGYLEGEYDLDEAISRLKRDTRRYAKRQLTWFKRDERIHWVETYEEAEKLVESFLLHG